MVYVKPLLTIICVHLAIGCIAQSSPREVWPEADVFYDINDKFRLFGLASATQIRDSSYYSDGSLGIHLDYFSYPFLRRRGDSTVVRGQYLWFRLGYIYAASTQNAEDVYKDNIFISEANIKFYLPFDILLTNRNRFDWKLSDEHFSLRYRPKLMAERNFKTMYLTFTGYVYGEYFFDFNSSDLNRLRLCLGAELRVSRIFNFELYWLHQFANSTSIPSVDAIGIVLKAYIPTLQRKTHG